MTDKERAYFDGFAINEGAYFYRRNSTINNRDIKVIFNTIKENAHSHTNIVEIIREPMALSDGRHALCSLKVFQDKVLPPFIRGLSDEYIKHEILICYFLLIEIDNYLVIFSRHANGLSSFKNRHTPVTGKNIAGALVNDRTIFTQMRMGNMNLNQYALRNKSYESDDLSRSMPTYGVGRQILKTARISNNDENITLGLSTARISKIGSERKTIRHLCEWADRIIAGINHPNNLETSLISRFAAPVRWKDNKDNINPSYLLIDFHELLNLIQSQRLSLLYKGKRGERAVNSGLEHFYRRLNGCKSLSVSIPHKEYICEDSFGWLKVICQENGIRLKSTGLLDDIYLVGEEGDTEKLISYINSHKCFYVGFEEVQFIYQGNQLHKDGDILNNLESILSIFEGILEMDAVSTEKGMPAPADINLLTIQYFML